MQVTLTPMNTLYMKIGELFPQFEFLQQIADPFLRVFILQRTSASCIQTFSLAHKSFYYDFSSLLRSRVARLFLISFKDLISLTRLHEDFPLFFPMQDLWTKTFDPVIVFIGTTDVCIQVVCYQHCSIFQHSCWYVTWRFFFLLLVTFIQFILPFSTKSIFNGHPLNIITKNPSSGTKQRMVPALKSTLEQEIDIT